MIAEQCDYYYAATNEYCGLASLFLQSWPVDNELRVLTFMCARGHERFEWGRPGDG